VRLNGHKPAAATLTQPIKPADQSLIALAAARLQRLAKSRADNYADWIEIGMSLRELGEAGKALWLNWSKQSAKFDEDTCLKKWATFKDGSSEGGLVTLARLAARANEDDPAGEAQPKPKGYTLHTAAEALQPQPPIEWVIDRLFSAASVAIIVGEPGSKKTYTMLDAAVCVAHGIPWLDFTTRQSPVLIIDEESGNRRMNRRLGEVLRGHRADDKTPIYFTTLERFQPAEVADELAIEAAIEETGARFVIVDALADIMLGGDENSVKDIQPVMAALRRIAERTQAVIVLIHHINKGGTYRGSSAIKAAVDLMLVAQSKPDESAIDFSIDKARDVEPFKFAARAIFDGDQVYLSSAELTAKAEHFSKGELYVLRYLRAHGGEDALVEIAAHADTVTEGGAKNAARNLAGRGYVQRVDAGGERVKAVYGLTDKARALDV
jgi:DNA-binding MarR family transcriptional regulator